MGKSKEAGPGEMLLSLAASPEASQSRGKQVHQESSGASPVNADPQVAQEAPYRSAGVLRAQSVHLAQQCSDPPAPHSWRASPTDRNPNTSPRDTCSSSPPTSCAWTALLRPSPTERSSPQPLRSGVHSEQTLVRVWPLLSLRAPSGGPPSQEETKRAPSCQAKRSCPSQRT